jgi:hypothetical protein
MNWKHIVALCLLAGGALGACIGKLDAQFNQSALTQGPAAGGGLSPTVLALQQVAELGAQGAGLTYNFNYTTLTNVNTGLIVPIWTQGTIAPISPTFNSVACVHIIDSPLGAGIQFFDYYCPVGSTAPGTYILHFTTASSNTSVDVCLYEFSGAAQTTAIENAAVANGATTSATATFSTTTDKDWGIGVVYANATSTGASGGYTLRTTCNQPYLVDTNGPITPAGSTSPAVNYASPQSWIMTVFGIKHG